MDNITKNMAKLKIINNKEGKVILIFDRPIMSMQLDGNQAIEIGRQILKQGRKANKNLTYCVKYKIL